MSIPYVQYIGLLNVLHSVPLPPALNPNTFSAFHREGYTLPFDSERRLARILAFLASASDGPVAIPAVCLAQEGEPPCLQVLLAVNKSNLSSNREVHLRMKEELDQILLPLSSGTNGMLDTGRITLSTDDM